MAFANTFKKRPQDLIGKHCYEIVHKTKEPIPDCPHRKTLKTGKSSTEEYLRTQY